MSASVFSHNQREKKSCLLPAKTAKREFLLFHRQLLRERLMGGSQKVSLKDTQIGKYCLLLSALQTTSSYILVITQQS